MNIHHGSLTRCQLPLGSRESEIRGEQRGTKDPAHLKRGSAGRTLLYKLLMLLKNRKLVTICSTIGGMVMDRVTRYTLLTILAVFGLKKDLASKKKGLILIHATILCRKYEQYSNAAVEERYHP